MSKDQEKEKEEKPAKMLVQSEMKLNPEVVFDKEQYFREKKELSELTERVSMIMAEQYLENQFLIGQWNHLEQQLMMATEGLKKQPLDVRLTLQVNNIQNDLEIIKEASMFVNRSIFSHIEIKYGRGKKFKYCKTM
jgi:hypothetical protein